MANQVTINQGDYVYFYDLSIGDIISREWLFPGGTPTGGTGFAQAVQYIDVNGSGFSVTLTVTDPSISLSKTENSAIVVDPQDFFVSLLITDGVNPISSTDMSRQVYFIATGPTGSGISQYTWNLPGTGGFTGSSNIVSLSLIDWSNLTGSDLGSVYTPFVTSPSVIATTVLNESGNSYQNLTYNKSGFEELLNLCEYPGITGPTYIQYYDSSLIVDPSNTSGFSIGSTGYYLTSGLGLSGNGVFVEINQTTPIFDNSYFHCQGELMTLFLPSYDVNSGFVNGQVIASYQTYNSLGVSPASSVSSLSRFKVGNYMYPGDISSVQSNYFYFGDTNSTLKNLGLVDSTSLPTWNKTYRGWSADSIESLINDISYASLSSKSYENLMTNSLSTWLPGFQDNTGTDSGFTNSNEYGGPCIPFSVSTSPLNWTWYIYTSHSRSLDDLYEWGPYDIELYNSGSTPNTPSGSFFVMGNNGYGDGISKVIEDWLSTNGLSSYIGVTAGPDFSVYERYYSVAGMPYPDPTEFNGIRISIKENYIGSDIVPLGITGPNYLMKISFSGSVTNTSVTPNSNYTIASWMGLSKNYITNPYQEQIDPDTPKRGWQFNG